MVLQRHTPLLAVLAHSGGLIVGVALQEVLGVAVRVDQDLAHGIVHLHKHQGTSRQMPSAMPKASLS